MMTTLPKGFDYHGVYCYRSQTDSSSFFYIPGAPSSQRTSQGNPMVSLMVLDQFAMLQLSSQWDVTSDQLDGLRTTIAKQFSLALDKIRLLPAPITVQEVVLSLKNNAGDFEVLATTQSSGYTPFSTVLSVDLTNEQKAQAIAAFNGRKDQLIVTYKASLEIEVSAEVTISGDVSTDLRKLPRNPALEDCLQQIETAIDRKRLKLELSASPEASDDLQQRTEQLAKERAAELLLSMAQGDSEWERSQFRAVAVLSETMPVALDRTTDVSTWFPSGSGLDYMQLIGSQS